MEKKSQKGTGLFILQYRIGDWIATEAHGLQAL